MLKRSVTLVEIAVVIVIIAILITVGIPAYQNTVEASKAKICAANQEALNLALDVYVTQHDAVPASLSQLDTRDIKNAYAEILQRPDSWKIKLAAFILDKQQGNLAYALSLSLKDDIAKGDINLITCPKDPTPPAQGGISYGINNSILGKTAAEYRGLPSDTIIIGDNETLGFSAGSDLAERHKIQGEMRAIIIQKNKEVWQIKGGNKKQKVK